MVCYMLTLASSVPTCAEVRLQLAEQEAKAGRQSGIVTLLAQGFSIEEAQ